MVKNFHIPGRPARSVPGNPAARTSGKFLMPGRSNGPVAGLAKARGADAPWYVPGLRRRGERHEMVEFTLTYEGDATTYAGLKLTYAEPV